MTIDVAVGVGGTLAAVLVSQWPKIAAVLRRQPKPPAVEGVTFQVSIEALTTVRSRLLATGGVSEEAGKAIETITLALVQGSDR